MQPGHAGLVCFRLRHGAVLILAEGALPESRSRFVMTRIRWGTMEFEFTRLRSDAGGGMTVQPNAVLIGA